MTTIAFRDGVLAADSLVVAGRTLRCGYTDKIWRNRDGFLFGLTGSMQLTPACREWSHDYVNNPCGPPIGDKDEAVLIMISPSGLVSDWYGKGWCEARGVPFHAWGSGDELALGAMATGASAAEAVRIAAQFDIHTGGDVLELKL